MEKPALGRYILKTRLHENFDVGDEVSLTENDPIVIIERNGTSLSLPNIDDIWESVARPLTIKKFPGMS